MDPAAHVPPVDAGPVVEIRTMFAQRGDAEACALRLVETRMAACVQVEGPVMSTYRWQGAVETAAEWRCVCKTSPARAAACRTDIVQHHPYQTPELIESLAWASLDYAAWVQASVNDAPGA